jgi:hypothetical protein
VQDWGRYLGDATMATTILDRLMVSVQPTHVDHHQWSWLKLRY